ncbi:MAG: replicative DNA helicase [Actinomycetota bacterium]|nr:replicative DNA helicase [Actinomycetota bacterium]
MSAPRVPLHDVDAEESLLGAMLLSNDAVAAGIETCSAGDFYKPAHGHIFSAIVSLFEAGEPVDAVAAAAELRRRGLLVQLGDPLDLVALQVNTASLAHAGHYARIVSGCAAVRRVQRAAMEIVERGFDPQVTGDTERFVAEAEQSILNAAPPRRTAGPVTLDAAVDAGLDEVRAAAAGERVGLSTGLPDLDSLVTLRPGSFVIVGARTSVGKSSFAAQVGLQVAQDGKRVLILSLEMRHVDLAKRYLAAGGVPMDRLERGAIDNVDLGRLERRREELRGVPIVIDDDPGRTLAEIAALSRREAARGDLGLVVVDYAQLVEADARETRQVAVAEIGRGLKKLAARLGVVVLAPAQLSRQVEYRSTRRPSLVDLRESGELEQSADAVLLLWRPDEEDSGRAEIIVAKNRHGPCGSVPVTWLPARMVFASAAPVGVDL